MAVQQEGQSNRERERVDKGAGAEGGTTDKLCTDVRICEYVIAGTPPGLRESSRNILVLSFRLFRFSSL